MKPTNQITPTHSPREIVNKKKIILDLCGGTGAWSRPYKVAGYDVRLVTLPDNDVRLYIPPENVYGVLAAPPCTEFARATHVIQWPVQRAANIS